MNRVVANRYEIQRRIGYGAASRVFLAWDQHLRREVAVKMLTSDASADPIFRARFEREAKAIGSISHPNVVTIYDWGCDDNEEYLVMEYFPGGTLRDLVRERGRLPEGTALRIGEGIAAALSAAHAVGVIHRDIKPQNVLLDEDGQANVVDFGIAWATGATALTQTNAICGTAHYISPESARGAPVDHRSDLYSLGAVLYEMLTGRPPFIGNSMIDLALHHVQDDPVPPKELNPSISDATNVLILRALSKDPAARFATAAEMRDAMDQILDPDDPQPTIQRPLAAADARPMEPRSTKVGQVQRPRPNTGIDRRKSRPARWPIPLGAAALLTLAGAVAVAHPWSEGGSAGALKNHRHTPVAKPTKAASPAAVSHPGKASRRGHTPVSRPTSRPAPTHRPAPTLAPAPAPAPAPTTALVSAPTSSPSTPVVLGAYSGPSSPLGAVYSFYNMVSRHNFSGAASLWTLSLQSLDPPQTYINGRFAGTQSITVDSASVTSMNESAGVANVAVHLTESSGTPVQTHVWIGSWRVVRTVNGWLLDMPSFG